MKLRIVDCGFCFLSLFARSQTFRVLVVISGTLSGQSLLHLNHVGKWYQTLKVSENVFDTYQSIAAPSSGWYVSGLRQS